MLAALKNCLHVSWQEDGSFSSIWPVWRHLVLDRCKGSRGQQAAGWAVKRNVNFIHHLCLCVFLCVDEHISSTHACFHVCLLLNLAVVSVNRRVESVWAGWPCQLLRSPLTRRLSGSLGTQTAAVIPSHNRPAKPWTSEEEVWYDESRMSLALGPCWTSSRQLPHVKPNFQPFKSTDLSQFFPSSFHFYGSQAKAFLHS